MRVMHVMAGAVEGGAENIMLESVLALGEAGHVQHVVTRPDNAFRIGKFEAAGIGTDTAGFNAAWPFGTRRVIASAIKAFKPDVIEYWMDGAGQFAPARHSARSVAWYDGQYKPTRFKACDWHVGLTTGLLRYIREQGISEDRSAIIHTYADFEGVEPIDRASLSTPERAPVALSLARLNKKKGLDTLLEAAMRLPDLYVWVSGDGPIEAELKAQTKRLGLDHRVRFLGWRNDRGALLAACDVVACPSRADMFGTVTVDAWAAGRPLVATDTPGQAAYMKDGVNGLLVAKNDVDALASALGRVVYDKTFAQKLVAGGRASYEAQFTKAAFQRDSLAFYEQVRAHAGPFGG
ncbi:MAG: glycosyltransferase [Hyphomonas sp.]